jgi:DNA-directed RNA polymerase specialized sigma24 family protein
VTDIVTLLEAWGSSRRIDAASNGYPSQSPFVREMKPTGPRSSRPTLPDDMHMELDYAVSSMRNRKPDHYAVIVFYYVEKMTDARIGRRMRVSRSTIRDTRKQAEHWLEGRMGI